MQLVLNNHIISAPMLRILSQIKIESQGYLRDIKQVGNEIKITCPFHKSGQESHPSCFVCASTTEDVDYGTYHCFTCGESGSLLALVAQCLNITYEGAKQWLIDKFGDIFVERQIILEPIQINRKVNTSYLNPTVLQKYNYYHPYMWVRKLSKQVVDAFSIGFDSERNAITFPVWDIHNNLVMITARCVDKKRFFIDKEVYKPVYLLNFIQLWNIDKVIVCESQLNALCAWSWGYPAIAFIGTGSKEQYDILNKSGIRTYILAFDGDEAGDKGKQRFLSNIRKDVFVTSKVLPRGKDVNDLTKEEFDNLPFN